MRLVKFSLCILSALAALFTLALPAQAAFVVTNKTEAVNNGNATLNSSSQSYTAGNVIVAMGIVRLATSTDTVGVSGALSGAFTLYECNFSAGGATPTQAKTFIAWKLAAGGAEVVTLTASATPTSMFLQIAEVSGAAASSPEDAAVRACEGTSSGTSSPTVTSGPPSEAGELIVSPYGRAGNVSGFTYTEDASNGWTQIDNAGGNTNVTWAGGYKVSVGSSAVAHNPATTSAGYGMPTMGFKSATPPAPACRGRLSLLGVGC